MLNELEKVIEKEIAKQILAKGMVLTLIDELTGLSLEGIDQLGGS